MKAYAFGGRAKWKDYVDMYFFLKNGIAVKEITGRADQIFEDAFNAKLFHQQLSYYEDIDYTEQVIFFKDSPSEESIKSFLREVAINDF